MDGTGMLTYLLAGLAPSAAVHR